MASSLHPAWGRRPHAEAARAGIVAYPDFKTMGFGRWCCFLNGTQTLIGFCGLKHLPGLDAVDVGYRYLPDFWGQGYATEACRASVALGLDTLALEEIIGLVLPENLARDDLVGPWVLAEDGVVVGLTGLLLKGKEAEIEPVVVKTGCRSRGLGTRLLEHAKAQAIAREVTHLSIRPVTRNAEAGPRSARARVLLLRAPARSQRSSTISSLRCSPAASVMGSRQRTKVSSAKCAALPRWPTTSS